MEETSTSGTALKGKRRPGGSQYCQKKKLKPEVASISKQ